MKNMRKFTWFILLVNLLFFIWVIAVGAESAGTPEVCEGLTGEDLEFCEDLNDIGTGLAIGAIIFIWALIDIVLGILWLVTNKGKRECPVCGLSVKKGLTSCNSCGYDFAKAFNHEAKASPPPPRRQPPPPRQQPPPPPKAD
tara:strand:+ start:95 stop:520 length:426 start_codon:yes stop_codon:yes gene_type:complete